MNSRYFGDVISPQVTQCAPVNNDQALIEAGETAALEPSRVPGIYFPVTGQQRDVYRTKTGKRLTPHQWNVYNFAMTIPGGKVATYKEVAADAGGSPRSVCNALRNNPFSPYVPCHRVIASDLFVGGFFGERGKDHKTGTRYNEKVDILSKEGVHFNEKGHLLSAKVLWKP
ncbi:methylated-DNA--cysteine S-met [Flammula alnicola]|nr:methylated-DNA--cysteine S-met [Flammula alnicola]